jgi:hypothetical protein
MVPAVGRPWAPIETERPKVTLSDDASTGERTLRTDDRVWTAAEKHKLRGLAKNNTPVKKIARTLNRSVVSTGTMAAKLSIVLDDSQPAI